MSKLLVTDDLWAIVAPLLPTEPPKPKGGRPRIPDRACLTGIIFVLKTGIPWELLPQEMGCGSGVTCWRRLRDWQKAGVWDQPHRTLLDRLGRHRRVVERTLAWLHRYRRLRVRDERLEEIHQAFLTLGCALICFQHLPPPERF